MDNSQYFYRTAIFTRRDNQVGLVDIDDPDTISPLDDWFGMVISLADGHHSIQQLIDFMTTQYPNPPANLEETLHSVIERLIEGKLIALSKKEVDLPYYLASPIEKLNIKMAREKIKEDGYIKH